VLIDRFCSLIPQLEATGWDFTEIRRYDPTFVAGTTPTGRQFTATLEGDVVIIVVGGRTRTLNRLKSQWLDDGPATIQAIVDARNLLPANQR
jgi:hypothetical protein